MFSTLYKLCQYLRIQWSHEPCILVKAIFFGRIKYTSPRPPLDARIAAFFIREDTNITFFFVVEPLIDFGNPLNYLKSYVKPPELLKTLC